MKRFRHLADELHFQAANNDALNEKIPYYDLAQGEKTGQEALAIAESWGPQLESLPLHDERPALRAELYAVLLLLAQLQGQQQPATVKELLDRAEVVNGQSRSFHRLRADYYDQLPDRKNADKEHALADDARTPATALDHFLQGEKHRVLAAKPGAKAADELGWRRTPTNSKRPWRSTGPSWRCSRTTTGRIFNWAAAC